MMLGQSLLNLQQEKGNICVSVIVPTHRLSPERRTDQLEVERAISKAKENLQYKYNANDTDPLIKAMDELYDTIDFNHNTDGIGIFVSPHVKHLEHFAFPVKEKVIVADNFEIRDLLYQVNYSHPYYLLFLTEKGARLFEGELNRLTEVKGTDFPKEYTDEYLYEHASRGTSYVGYAFLKDFEKDKSVMEEIRHEQFFKKVDELLNAYLVDDTPLLVTAVSKELSWFEKVSKHKKLIAATIEGNYTYNDYPDLPNHVWDKYKAFVDEKINMLIKDYKEKIGEKLGVEGLEEVWNAAKEGRGFKLLVEKDFRKPGFVDKENESKLYLHPPKILHKTLADAVDDIIETVLEKNGKVYFTDNDVLKDHHHIALITRY